MDERCELYMLNKDKRESLKDGDMAKRIHTVLYMSDKDKEALRSTYPARQTFMLSDGIQVTSDFESGNTQLCIENQNQPRGEHSFDMWLQTDSHPYVP